MTRDENKGAESCEVFRPVVAARVSDEVVDQICHAIHTGLYEVGDRLPRVDELASVMEVSIASASEAVGVLARANVLQVKRGASGGVVVASSVIPADILRPPQPVARSLLEVVEARRPVELELSQLAAERATEDDFLEMRRAIEMQAGSIDDLETWAYGNFKFHYSIGRAARSALLFHFQTEITKELARFLVKWTPRDQADPEATLSEHREIVDALEARKQDRVASAVDRHLLELEQLILEAAVDA